MTDIFADKLNAARSRIAASLLPKISSAVAASSASKLTATPMGNNLKEHIANGGQPTNDMINYFNDKTIADGVNRQNISDAQQNDYFGVSTANLTSSNVFMAAAANAVNLAGGAVGTLAQWGNTLAGDEFTAQAIAMESGTPAHVVDAYNALNRTREKKNQLAERSRVIREQIRNKQGDPIQLNAQLLAIETAYKGIQIDPNVMNTLSVKKGDTTYLEHLDASQELRHKGARVTAGSGEGILPAMKSSDFSNPYYKKPLEQANKGDQFITDTNALADRQLDEGTLTGTLQGIGNKVLATGKSIGNVLAAGVDSPMGVLQYTAESAPYFLAPELGTVAIVNQTAVEGRHKFEERTGQALPTTGQNAAMLATDALYGALNYIGDKGVQSAIRGTTAASVRSSRQILLDSVKGVGSTGLRAAGKEGLAEGAQTYLEESGQNLGTYFNPDTVGQAAAIGALSSGVVSTPADLKHGVKNYKINKFLNSPAGQEALAQIEKQKVLDAIPLAELQDPTSANHNPVEAINRMTTGVTEATKDTVIKDVSALVNNLQDVVTERETSLANAELRVAEANKNIPIIDQLIASGNTDPRLVVGRKDYVDYLEGDGSPENIKKLQDLVTTSTSELVNAHEHAKIKLKAVRDAFGVANPNTATPSVPSINPSTGGTVYPYPSKGAGLRAALEANDSTKNYTPEQRDTLRAFSDAVVLIHSNKDLQKVGIDIKQGGNTGGQKYRGLEQYMERVVEAINNGNVRSQQYFNKGLALFSQSHTSKAETFQKAFDTLTPGMVNIVQKNDDTNTWEIYDTVTEKVFNSGNFKEGLKNTGGYGIHRNSLKFIETVKSEAEGIAQVSDAINLMVNGSQSVAPTPAVPPVVAPTPPVVTEPLNDIDTEVKNKILSEYPITKLVYGGRSRTAQDAIKAQDLKAMKKAYNLLKAEEQIKLLEANNKKIEAELAVKRELFRKTKATKVGDIVTIVNDEEGGGEYRAKILELTKYKTTALLKIKVKSGKEYNISVDQYGDTRTGNIENFVFEAEAPETRPQLLEEINNLKAQIQEVKDTSDYYVDYFKEGTTTPIVTEPSDTTPVDVTPAPEAPVQSDNTVSPTVEDTKKSIDVLLARVKEKFQHIYAEHEYLDNKDKITTEEDDRLDDLNSILNLLEDVGNVAAKGTITKERFTALFELIGEELALEMIRIRDTPTPSQDTPVDLEATKQVAVNPKPLEKSIHNTELDNTVNKGVKGYVPIKIPNVFGEYGIYYAKPVTIEGSGDFKFYVHKYTDGSYSIVEFATGVSVTDSRAEGSIKSAVAQLTKYIADNGLKSFEALYSKYAVINSLEPSKDTTPAPEPVKQASTQTTADTEQLTEDLEAKIEARDNIIALHKEYLEIDAKDNPTGWEQTRHDYLEDLFSDVIGAVANITYGKEMPSKEIQDELKKLIGEELFNEAMRIRNLPLSERDIAQNLLRQLIPVLRGVPEKIDDITLNMLDGAKSEARERAVNRKGEAAGKVFDDVYLKLEKYLKSVETKTPPTKGIGKDTTTATPSDTVSIDKLEATVKSFVKVRDITSEEYKQDTATVYEKQWFKVKAAYNNTVRRLVELVSKGVTTVEDVAALTDILNKLYEFAGQTIDLNSDRAALDKLTQRIDSLATALFSDVSPEIIDAYLKGKTESLERRGDKLTTDRDGAKSFDGRTIEYAFNAPHLQETKTTAPVEAEPSIPETAEGMVKEYGYLGELLEDEGVEKSFKQEVEKILKLKAATGTRQTSFSSFVDFLAFDGGIEYFTRLAKNDPNIIKLTKAANKLHNLMRLAQHITVLNDYHQGDRSINLKEYLDTRPELKSIFEEIRDLKTGHTLVSVIVDLQEAKDVLRSETEKLVTLVGLMYIQAAFEKGQQYLIDTNYADLDEVIFQYTLGLSSHKLIGQLQKHKVVGNDSKGVRKLITPTELSFLDKIDGVPVGELSKEDFETVKALVQNRVNGYFNQYEVLEYPRKPEKVYSQIVHDTIVEHLPKEGFTLENFTPEEVIKGAVPQSFIWDFEKKAPETTEDTGKDNKADLILPIGTSGSGKSTWIKSVNSEGDYTVISLDDLRVELTGDVDNKTSDEAVYTEAVNRAVAAVKAGKQVIFDTTNLKKDRRAVIIDAIRKAKPDANIQYKLLPLDPALAKQRIKDALAKGEARANVSDATIDRHAASYTQALEDIKQEGITAFPEPKAKESTEVVVVPESIVPITPPDSETGDVEIQEDVSTLPEVAEPKEKTTPAGGLSILAGTGSVKDRMKAEQEKAANNSKGIGSVVPIDTTKADEKTVKAWFAEASEKANKVITTGIQRANLVVASFYQKLKAPSKLVQVKDFAKTVLAMSPTEQAQMLSDALGETATDSQVQFLENFLMFDKSLRGTMDIMAVPTGKNNFRFKDYLQYLFTDVKTFKSTTMVKGKPVVTDVVTGTLDENIKTAISVGIHTFLIEKTSQFSLDHEGVAELLGFSNTKSVPYEVHRMFKNVGNVQPNVVKYLGTKAYQALQLSMDPSVPAQRKESLINALGSLAVQTMLAEGLLQYTRIPNDIIKDAKAAIEGGVNTAERNENIYTVYLRPAYDTKQVTKNGWTYESEPKPIARIEALKVSAKGNTKVMSKLFSVEGRDILPMLKKPTKFTQDTLSKTGNEVPDATADLVLEMMQKAYNVNGYTYSAMKTLFETDPDALYAMVGVVSDEDVAKQHISIRGATESKNEALKRSVTNGLDFIDSLTPDEDGNFPDYYLPMSVWSVNRVGVSSNLFNEQGDKVHRALTTMTAHKQQVTISPVVDSDNKLTQYGRFLTGVAAYMEGVKINGKTVDKTDGVSFLPGFERFIKTPVMQDAIKAVGSMVMGSATDTEIQIVKDMVISLEGGAMSLTSLIALYEASQAKEVEVEIDGVKTKVTQFTTSMSTGSDGVTNGMALSLLMYDAATPLDPVAMPTGERDAFNAGGIFFEGDSVDSMVKFRKSGKSDLYEQLAKVQKDLLKKFTEDRKNAALLNFIAAMNNIDPTFGTRAGAKVSLVPFVYGSGFRSIGAAQSRAFMEQFYKALTKAMLSGDAAKIKQFQANYVALAQGARIPVAHDFTKMSVKDALDTELSLRDVKAITGVENKIRKAITKDALSQVAGTLIQARSRVSGLANVGFESYNRIYTALQEMAHAKLKAANALPYRYASSGKVAGETVAVEGMNVKQNQAIDDELKDFTPQIISVGGVHSVNGVQSAHSMWEETQIKDTSSTGEVSSEFGDIAEGVATPNNMVNTKASKSITTSLHTRSVESRGAATNAAIVQAMDAWITAKVSAAMDTFNHHDENVSSIDKAAEMGQLQNKTLFNAVLDYDVYLEVLNGSLLRPLRGIIKLSKRDDTLAIAKGEVGKVMADLTKYMKDNFGGFNEDMGMLASLVHEMYALEIAKLTKYKNLKSISQYGIEGGEYTVTKKDVARINDLIASHVASRTALLKEVAKISADLKAIGAKPKAEPEVKAETKEETPKGKPTSVDSFIVRNEEGIVDTLATLNSMPINDSTLVGKVIKQVVEALKGKLPANLKVHMITGSNLPTALDNDKVKDSLSRNAPGITYSTGNTHTIGLVEGKAGKITFIHELIHAATVSGLSGTSAEARKLKFNISKLRGEALSAYRKYTASLAPVSKIEAERRDKVYMDAFNSEGDKDAEFVAMAMSEPAIIDFLATVPAPKLSSVDTGLISIFSAFIKSVSEFLGLTKNAKGKDVESVLSAMVNQTAQLMNINDQSSASDQVNNYPGQQAAVDAVRLIREYPSKEVFNVLPASLDVGFDTYLSSLMDTIVDKTFNHLSFPSTTYTPLQVWENAITDGRTPYTTRAVAAGFILSERELFAIETLEVALKGAMDAGITTPVYKEMERAYESARKTLKDESFYNGDWSTALESDREIARNKRKHLFKLEGGQATRSDYMSRFMAMALASSEVNSLLGFPTLTEARVDGTIFSKILAYYEYAMDWVSGHLTGTMRYQTINSKLPTLAQKLVDIDHKKRDQALSSVYDSVSDNLNKADKYLKESGNALADKLENMIGDSKKGLPSAARTASRVVLRGAAMDMLKVAKIWRDMSAPNTVLGWKGELLNELSDPSSVGQAVRSLLRIHTRLQTERKTHKSTTKESILSNFLNGGKNLSKDDHSAITYGVLRGDLKALYDLHGIRGIEKLLNNADEVESEVARLEGLITNETHIVRAKDLAHYMTSGEVNLMLAKNALSIARDVGLPTVLEEGMVSEEAVSNIDMLVSLYAIQYMKSSHLQTLQKLFKQEGARTDGNGLAALMKYHQAIEQEAKDTLFEGNSVSIIKGYTPEITNPHREIKIVTLASDAKHLEAMGYQLHSILSADPNDVNQAKRMMYFTEEPSTQRFVTGAMSLTADSSKGTSIIDGSSLSVKDKISALKSITTRSATKLKAKSAKDYDPTNIKNRGMSPTYSNLGSIQDFRYEMTHATRDGLLQRNNNFAEIMGTYAGSNFDKASTPKHNETVIDALYKDYKENYLKDPRAYVQIGKDSTDPRAVEMYAMLPYKTRKYIDKVWGKRESMWVRNDALLATFGTNKYSIGGAFEKNPDTRNLVETTIVDMFKVLFGDTAKLRALQGERLNQELVSWFKSTIVIRNLTTLMGNQSANVGVLLTMGVSPVDIIKDSVTAFKAGNRFRKDNTELVRVENNMKANVGNFEDNVQLQARLKDSIARNPLKQFLDAGMLNTIVEDVSLDVEDYNYKSKLAQQLDDQLDKLNPTVRKIGANLVVAPSTELYQVLANATQLSDFTAKYTLYKHLTSKAKDKLSHEDALAMADRMFINYDVPTSKELQYANDMGLLMFTKYTLRIQRAIAYLLKERKASLLAQGMLGTALGMPLATAPAFFNVIGNPFHPGALMVPGALTQPLPIKVLSGGF